ncbi:MAG: nitroreductase family protein [Spiroplasma sp.]
MKTENHLVAALNTIISTRKSSKKFNNQIIDNKTLISILESANQCPSSFGLEPWKILVIKNQKLKAEIQKFCDNQQQVTTCSHLLVVLSYKGKMFVKDNPWMIMQSKKKRILKDDESYFNFYQKSFFPYMKKVKDWDQWSIRQSYILLQTILLVATAHNVATSTMEGSKLNKINSFLEANNIIKDKEKDEFNCSFVIALGYSDEEAQIKKPKNLEETFIIIN